MSTTRAVLAGVGISVPPRVVDNDTLARAMDTNDEWIRERSGIETRRYVEAGVGSSDLGVEAARAALADAGLEAGAVDYIVCATMTPDHYFPGSGTLIQTKLGIDPVPALDIRQQCAGFAYGLQIVDALIRSGAARTVLLVGTDVHTSLMPFSPATWDVINGVEGAEIDEEERAWNSQFRHLVVLFGDAAGAMVFRAESGGERGILAHRLFGNGEEMGILYVPGGGSKQRPYVDHELLEQAALVPVMEGRTVFKHAVSLMPQVTEAVLHEAELSLDDLDLLVMHQANLRINEFARRAMKLPESKVHNNIQRYGNTTSATLPLCFHEARAEGKAPEGSLVAFTALGAGLHWGSVLVRV